MIVLVTDFGIGSPYIAQMKSVLIQQAANVPIVELFSDAPRYNPRASAYLLPAYVQDFPETTVFLCVVDPGVGSPQRKPVIVKSANQWFVGPDNGLFNMLLLRSHKQRSSEWWDITWQPDTLSNSFHARDLFAPVAAKLSQGQMPGCQQANIEDRIDCQWPDDLFEIIYIDHFGNAITGLRASQLTTASSLIVNDKKLNYARTFSEVAVGQSFWYENANGLVEIATNQGNASIKLSLSLGDSFVIQ